MDSLLSMFVLKRIHTLSHAKDQNNTSDIIGISHAHGLNSSITRSQLEILGTTLSTVLVYPTFSQLSMHI